MNRLINPKRWLVWVFTLGLLACKSHQKIANTAVAVTSAAQAADSIFLKVADVSRLWESSGERYTQGAAVGSVRVDTITRWRTIYKTSASDKSESAKALRASAASVEVQKVVEKSSGDVWLRRVFWCLVVVGFMVMFVTWKNEVRTGRGGG